VSLPCRDGAAHAGTLAFVPSVLVGWMPVVRHGMGSAVMV